MPEIKATLCIKCKRLYALGDIAKGEGVVFASLQELGFCNECMEMSTKTGPNVNG